MSFHHKVIPKYANSADISKGKLIYRLAAHTSLQWFASKSLFTSSDLYCCDAIVIITVYSITVMEDDPWDNITKLEGW